MSKVNELEKYIQSLDGYKISNTHFKIGAKIHSTDFYYAKRLFQNSYYTARIAMLLAIKIKEQLKDEQQPITIVGYEMYSELLLSLIKKFLNEFRYTKINHYVTTDIDGAIKYLPGNDVLFNDKIVIVVPITSTGSTTGKIIENIKKKRPETPTEPFISFTVLQSYDEDDKFENLKIKQDALITLKTKWQEPSDCKWCFNNDESKPLFETDKSSLTPTLIFDLPSAKEVDADTSVDFDKVDFEDALIYRRIKRNNEHFLFSTNTDILIENKSNRDKIDEWLDDVRKKLDIKPTDKIVIISPCHYSNSQFINLVNDKLFHSSATIIHHQTDVDYLANFKLLNETFLKQKNTKIFFVDDSLISGHSFFSIYDLYRYTTDYKENLSGAIFLSNKSSTDIHTRVSRASKHVYSFININLPTHPKIFDKKPLEHEVRRYDELSKTALHDAIKMHFIDKSKDVNGEKKEKLEEVNDELSIIAKKLNNAINEAEKNDYNKTKQDLQQKKQNLEAEKTEKDKRHIKMFKATHKVYEYFQNHRNIANISFEDLLKECGFNEKEIEDKMTMLKVLSQYPFLLYQPVREKTFKWHKEWLDKIKEDHKKPPENNTFTYNQFCELKFLIRRAVFLGNYSILEQDFFILIHRVFTRISNRTTNPIKKTIEIEKKSGTLFNDTTTVEYERQTLTKREEINLDDFHIFLIQKYVELFHQNGWCANKIIENIKGIENEFNTLQGEQFIRMLKIEAAAVLNDFYALLNDKEEWRKLYKSIGNERKIDTNNNIITGFLEQQKILDTNKFDLSNKVLKLMNAPEKEPINDLKNLKSQFVNYLWLKQFLNTDLRSQASDFSLTDKTEAIFQKLKGFFTNDKIGAFFVVNDGRDTPRSHLVYDKDPSGSQFLHELNNEKHKLIFQFMDGEEVSYAKSEDGNGPENGSETKEDGSLSSGKGAHNRQSNTKGSKDEKIKKSIIEYEYVNSGNEWKDLYTLNSKPEYKSFVTGCQWVLLIRISDSDFKTLGLIGFYGDKELQNELLAKQLLMLLRTDIGLFIKKHHKNDEFSALREAEAVKRFAYLAGHGRQMIQKLAQKDNETFGDVVATMEKLQYLFATKLIDPKANTNSTKKESDKELLTKVFSSNAIDKDVLKKIRNMGNKIYETNIIENKVSITPIPTDNTSENGITFKFNGEILTFICFELFVNAKKNRFHFIETCPKCKTDKNDLNIKFEKNKDNQLIISLTGTGTKIPNDVPTKINEGHSIKPGNEIAGLDLILKVIKTLNKRNKLSIKSHTNKSCCEIHENTVTITLYPIDES